MDSIIAFFEHYSEYGNLFTYILIFLVLLISGFGVPIPEDITLVTAGIIASQHGIQHGFGYFGVSMLGVLVGDSVMFAMGYIYGVRILRFRMLRKIMTPKRIQTIRYKFNENATAFLFIARFLPGLRAAVYLFSGVTRKIHYQKFVAIDFCAAIISVPIWVTIGYLFGNNLDYLKELVHSIGLGVAITAIIAILAIIFFIRRSIMKKRLEDNAKAQFQADLETDELYQIAKAHELTKKANLAKLKKQATQTEVCQKELAKAQTEVDLAVEKVAAARDAFSKKCQEAKENQETSSSNDTTKN